MLRLNMKGMIDNSCRIFFMEGTSFHRLSTYKVNQIKVYSTRLSPFLLLPCYSQVSHCSVDYKNAFPYTERKNCL